jgi:hypothetical protein
MGHTSCTPLRCPTQEAAFSRACFYLDSKSSLTLALMPARCGHLPHSTPTTESRRCLAS